MYTEIRCAKGPRSVIWIEWSGLEPCPACYVEKVNLFISASEMPGGGIPVMNQ